MSQTWQDYLQAHYSEVLSKSTVTPTQIQDTCLCLLNQWQILEICGADATPFLQGQLTCDVEALLPKQHSFGAYCNIKGRVESLFHLIKFSTEQYWLIVPTTIASYTQSELQKYVLFSKVKLSIIDDYVLLGLYKTNTTSNLPEIQAFTDTLALSKWPAAANVDSIANNDAYIYRQTAHESGQMFWLACKVELAKDMLAKIRATQLILGNSQQWQYYNILAGVPTLNAITHSQFLPHHLNLLINNAVSVEKGCYRGQEIITRMAHRGTVKKGLYLMQSEDLSTELVKFIARFNKQVIEDESIPDFLDKLNIYPQQESNTSPIGKFVSLTVTEQSTLFALAELPVDYQGLVYWQNTALSYNAV